MSHSFVAILRGINVGGRNKIKMAELSAACTKAGLADVQTYIQSGNILFSVSGEKEAGLEVKIQKLIDSEFGLTVPVIVRKAKDWKKAVAANPWGDSKKIEPKHLHVTFLQSKPPKSVWDKLELPKNCDDEYEVKNKEVFVHCPGGYGKTKLTNTFFEKKLGVLCTTRNWNSCLKIAELLE